MKMANFDALNRQTRDFNNRNVDRFNCATRSNYSASNLNRLNGDTYKSNNGQCSAAYYGRYSSKY